MDHWSRPAVALAAVVLAPMALRQGAVHRREVALLKAVVEHRPAASRLPARVVTELGGVVPVSMAVGAAALVARDRGVANVDLVRVLGCVGSGVFVRRLLAVAARRERPPSAWWWSEPSGYSYPSRHVTWVVLGSGAIEDLLVEGECATLARRTVVASVAATRVLLAVHWPTDVLAGLVFATSWRQGWRGGPPRGASSNA